MLDLVDKKYFKLAVGSNLGRETDVDISAKCPVCGDSKIHANSKRLHLYEKNGVTLVHCFNGDCRVTPQSMDHFLKYFFPELHSSYRREKNFRNLENFKSYIQSETETEDVFKTIKEQKKKKYEVVNLTTFEFLSYFINIKDSPEGITYLRKRGFELSDIDGIHDIFYSKINMNIDNKFYKLNDFIVIPLYVPSDINGTSFKPYGFYSRSTKDKMFYTYMPETNQGYKIWNWFNIDKEQPVYIFEGIFDALSAYKCGLKNVVACMGATIPQERINELKNPVFCLDNDKTGLLNTMKYCKNNYNVVVFPENLPKDANEMLLQGLDVKSLINNCTYSGIVGIVKIRKRLS